MDCRDIFKKLDLHGYEVVDTYKLCKRDRLITKNICVIKNLKHKYKIHVYSYERSIYGIEKVNFIMDHDDIELLYQLEQELKKEHGI